MNVSKNFWLFLVILLLKMSSVKISAFITCISVGYPRFVSRSSGDFVKSRFSTLSSTPPKKKTIPLKKIPVAAQSPKSDTKSLNQPKSRPVLPLFNPSAITDEEYRNVIRIMNKLSSPEKMKSLMDDCYKEKNLNIQKLLLTLKGIQSGDESSRALLVETMNSFLSFDNHLDLLTADLLSSSYVIHFLCINSMMDYASKLASKLGLSPLTRKSDSSVNEPSASLLSSTDQEKEIYSAILGNIAYGYAISSQYNQAVKYLEQMKELNLPLSEETATKIFQLSLKETNLTFIKKMILLLRSLHSLNSFEALQLLTSYMIRSIEFVKGAVSVETLPPTSPTSSSSPVGIPEIIFMGRSNVGKSSLINMITNRKGLAYTSKKAGKTSEFNYFHTKGVFGAKNSVTNHPQEEIQFYLVDLPGVGYAKKSKEMREKWIQLMNDYIENRQKSLKCIFHLIDSRHGILETDYECFSILPYLPTSINYCVVFTKIDKLHSNNPFKFYNGVSIEIIERTTKELERLAEGTERKIPLLYTSATEKEGGVDVLYSILQRVSDSKAGYLRKGGSSSEKIGMNDDVDFVIDS
jgi:GTP-binding protein